MALTNEFVAIILAIGLMLYAALKPDTHRAFKILAYTGVMVFSVTLFFIGDTVPFFMLLAACFIFAGFGLTAETVAIIK